MNPRAIFFACLLVCTFLGLLFLSCILPVSDKSDHSVIAKG